MMKLRILVGLFLIGVVNFSALAADKINVTDAYARATFAMATTGAVYLTLQNHSSEQRTLTSVSVDKSLADDAQIHTTQMMGEMVKMREVKEGVKLPSHQNVSFMPGGHHIMLLGLNRPLKEGESINLTLLFDNGATKDIRATIRKTNGKDSQAEHHSHAHH
ncbi:copper chaperone PCu(A)C [Alteromonas sp. ASW11-130]|uniref:copper chaperone PCu(A)C n=1 Tax=Alteromonas sp. ASW11-130 TaxID=3015775 RepID=UPI002241FB9C|nr:copper chaperone PCu(A)C [Alteromonas sp. ASW11-130]MCW8090858.1 copper chaperone PCu(A)C [Alteromonas sp. ASW11-130]